MQPSILVVEDEAPLVELLKYNLEASGYDVDVVMRGDDADIQVSYYVDGDPEFRSYFVTFRDGEVGEIVTAG